MIAARPPERRAPSLAEDVAQRQEESPVSDQPGPIEHEAPLRRTPLRACGIGVRLFLVTFPIIALIVLLTQFGIGLLAYREQLRNLHDQAHAAANITAAAIARPLWALDQSVFEAQVRALDATPAFVSARVFDENEQAIFAHTVPDAGTDKVVMVTTAIVEPAQRMPLGRLEVTLSTNAVHAHLRHLFAVGMVAFLILVCGFFMVSIQGVRQVVLRPVRDLLAAMRQVEQKHWVNLPVVRCDEMGELTEGFNRMVNGLKSGDEASRLLARAQTAETALKRANASLEQVNLALTHEVQERKTLTAELERQASTDELTLVSSRRRFYEVAANEIDRYRRTREPLALLLIDLDHFKHVNDRFGHAVGDEVLKAFGAAAQRTVRAIDVVGRIGGEEFAILLPACPLPEAQQVAERLRCEVGALDLGPLGLPEQLTVSIGLARLEDADESIDAVLHRADMALYRAKAAGRDRVEIAL